MYFADIYKYILDVDNYITFRNLFITKKYFVQIKYA